MALVLRLLCLFSVVALLHASDQAVVFVVDPTWDCTESYVAHTPLLQDYKIIKVMTNPSNSTFCNSDHADIYQTIVYQSFTPNDSLAAQEICPKLKSMGVPIAAVIATFDPAVYLADLLAACVGTRANPSEGLLAKARRDKSAMSEAVRKAGLRAIKEKLVTTWSEAREYIESLDPPLSEDNPIIFKIVEGSSGEGVTKIYSMKQAEATFKSDFGSTFDSDSVAKLLVQELLRGKEYVIDSASRDGVHKVSMVYNEDLRPGDGIFNQYYGFKTMDPEDQKTKVIIDYANKVLDATGLRNGASDMEVIWVEGESTPCVIDLNARWGALMYHDGLELMKELTGSDQITSTINAYLDGDAFNKMPLVPSLKQHGAMTFMYVHHTGIVEGIPGQAVAKKLPSYFGSSNEPARGTIASDVWSILPETIVLIHKDKAVVDADYNRIIALEYSDKFFDIVPSAGHTLLTALRPGDGSLPGHRLPAIAASASALAAIAAASALAAMSRRNARDATDYLPIE